MKYYEFMPTEHNRQEEREEAGKAGEEEAKEEEKNKVFTELMP
jgi:hypothetical protein